AYCPDDQEYLDLRLTRDNINGKQFVNLLRLLRATHPETERFVLYLDRAKYYGSPVVKDWLRRHPEFELEPLPTDSPNLNLIERLWKFLRKRALTPGRCGCGRSGVLGLREAPGRAPRAGRGLVRPDRPQAHVPIPRRRRRRRLVRRAAHGSLPDVAAGRQSDHHSDDPELGFRGATGRRRDSRQGDPARSDRSGRGWTPCGLGGGGRGRPTFLVRPA